VKTSLTICVVGVAMAATLSFVAAGNYKRTPVAARTQTRVTAVREPRLVFASSYTGVAHIIHIPQRDERRARASVSERDEPEITANRYEPVKPRHRSAPRWPLQSETPPPPPPPLQRRAVLSAPPPLADGPSPIRPLPRIGAKSYDAKSYDAKTSDADKFSSPDHPSGAPADIAPPLAENTPSADLAPASDQPDMAK
jgi:hypothetical protein